MVNTLSHWCHWASLFFIFVMMMLTTADVILRYIFNRPILGAYEISQFLLVLVVSFGVAEVMVLRGHVEVELVFERLPRRVQRVLGIITSFISLGFFLILSWQTWAQAKVAWIESYETSTLYIPQAPFLAVLGVGFTVLLLVLFCDWLRLIFSAGGKG